MKQIIETLSAGFEAIYRRPWVLLLPIALDLLIWLGPQVSLQPLTQQALDFMNQLYDSQAGYEAWSELQQFWQQTNIQQVWEQFGRQFNLLSILSTINVLSLLSLGNLELPSLAAKNGLRSELLRSVFPVVEINRLSELIISVVMLLAVGLLMSAFYQGAIAQQVREEAINIGYLFRRLKTYWLHLLAVALILVAILFIVGWPLGLLFFIAGAFSPGVTQGLFFASSVILFWLGILISFTPHGILLGEEKPLNALWVSLGLVRRNFWPTLFLLLLIRIIRAGLTLVWPLFTGTLPGTLVAIVGNSFVSGGLAAASFVFYRDRFAAWREDSLRGAISKP